MNLFKKAQETKEDKKAKKGKGVGRLIITPLPKFIFYEGNHYEEKLKRYFKGCNMIPEFRIQGHKLLEAAGVTKEEEKREIIKEGILRLALKLLQDRGYKVTGIGKKENSDDSRDWTYTFSLTKG